MKGDDIAERLLDFAVAVVHLAADLPEHYAGRHVERQLVRSGTGGGSNYEEARSAESRADFVHKLSVATKELRESHYWLRLIERAQLGKAQDVRPLVAEAGELVAILTASIRTAKGKRK